MKIVANPTRGNPYRMPGKIFFQGFARDAAMLATDSILFDELNDS